MSKRMLSAALVFLLLIILFGLGIEPANAAEAPEASWSQPVDGLRARLMSDRKVYEEGQYVWLYLDALNTTDKSVNLAWGKSLEDHFTLRHEGEVVKPQRTLDSLGVCTLSPHKQTDLMLFYVSGNQYSSFGRLKPGKYEAVWTSARGETAANLARLAPPARVTFEVVPAKPRPTVVPAEVPNVPWGEPKGGLHTRLRAATLKFPAGAPIPIVVEVNNVSNKVVRYHVPQVAQNGRIKVLDAAGRAVPYTHGGAQTANPLQKLNVNGTATLDAVDLSEYYFLRKPGRYSARWPGARAWSPTGSPSPFEGFPADPPDSDLPATNTFEFEVTPSGFHDPFQEALGVILENRPKEWSVSSMPPVSQRKRPGSQWSRVPGRRYSLEHKDMFRNNRLDRLQIHPIRFYLTSEKAIEKPWEKASRGKTECLGRGKYGWLYLAPVNQTSLQHWPGVRADLVKWLEILEEK